MTIGLTKYGRPQVVIFPLAIIAAMTAIWLLGTDTMAFWMILVSQTLLAVMLIWVLCFFRDPDRDVPTEEHFLLAPADGTVTDIESVQSDELQSQAIRIGIFLSIFDVHINRSPCRAIVENIRYKKGQYLDARNPLAGKLNESNDLLMSRTNEPKEKLLVRQISGAIARRIVCEAKQGNELKAGEKFGMIKFGSRTELYFHSGRHVKVLVQAGDKVKAGTTALVRYV